MQTDLPISLEGGAALALLAFALILVFLMVRSVPQGEEWTVERFGRYTRTLSPGLNFVVPIMDRVGKQLNMMETVLDIDGQEVITRDNVQVQADAIAFFQIVDAAAAAYEVRDLFRALNNLAQTNIRTVIGAMDLDDVLSNRDMINVKLLGVIDQASTPWGVKVTRVEIKDLAPPKDIIASMARQMKAERDKRAEILTAEGRKQGAILEAEGLREAQIREAEGRREAAFLDAEARERGAQAEAKATAMVSRAIAEGDIQAINYFVAQKYTEALQGIASSESSKVIMMPLEASSLIGSVAGIAEIARDATTGRKGGGGGGKGGGGSRGTQGDGAQSDDTQSDGVEAASTWSAIADAATAPSFDRKPADASKTAPRPWGDA